MKYHIIPGQTLYSDALDRPDHHTKQHEDHTGVEGIKTDDSAGLRPGYTHLQLPTLLQDEELSVDITRYERFLSFRVNGYSEIIISDGIARDGVVQVPNHVLIPSYRHDSSGLEGEGLLQVQEKVLKAQEKGADVDVEDLMKILKPFVEQVVEEQEKGAEEEL